MNDRYPRRFRSLFAIGAALTVLGVSGCASDDSPESGDSALNREASAAPRTCTQDGIPNRVELLIENRLQHPMVLNSSSIDCFDWDGKTPAYYNPLEMGPQTRRYLPVDRYETSTSGGRKWTMGIAIDFGAETRTTSIRLDLGGGYRSSFSKTLGLVDDSGSWCPGWTCSKTLLRHPDGSVTRVRVEKRELTVIFEKVK